MDARPDDDAEGDDITGAQHPTDPSEQPDDDRQAPPPPAADDEVWASIVARLSDDDGGTDPAVLRSLFGVEEDQTAPGGGPSLDGPPTTGAPRPVGRDWDGTTQYDAAEDAVDDLEHFVPEDPGPVTSGDPLLTLAWGAAAGVPLLMLVVVTVWRDAPTLLVRAALVLFVAAVAVLVWRMPHRRDPSDDDGAVV